MTLTTIRGFLVLLIACNVFVSCRTASVRKANDLSSISDGDSPSNDDTDISADRSLILAAMTEARDRGIRGFGLDPAKSADIARYKTAAVEPCLIKNDVPRWSDLVHHYYCQHGNLRQCFSTRARSTVDSFTDSLAHYKDTFKFCSDTAGTDVEWAWLLSDAQRLATFRYLMFTNGRSAFNGKPEAFKQADQDSIINEFYGVAAPKTPAECHKRPRRHPNQEPDPVDQHCGK